MGRHSLCFKRSGVRRCRSVNFTASVVTRICIGASSNVIEVVCGADSFRDVLLLYGVIPLLLHMHILNVYGGVDIRKLLVIATRAWHCYKRI